MNLKATGAKLRELRQRRNFSQQQLAEIAGVSLMTVNRIELGKISAKLETLGRLTAALGTTVPDLLQETTNDTC